MPQLGAIETNSKLNAYYIDRDKYFYLIPNNINDYEYLSHNLVTAYSFIYYAQYNPLDKLSVRQIKSGSMGIKYYPVLHYYKLKNLKKRLSL